MADNPTPVAEVILTADKEPIFSPTRFIKNIRPTRRVHFDLEIALPIFLIEKYNAYKLTLTAVSTNIPTVRVENLAVRRGTVSYKESFPTNISFGDLSITFYSDMEGQTLSLFREWIDFVFPTDMNTTGRFSVPYKENYAATIYIYHYDSEGKRIMEYKFEEAFPETIADIPFNWAAFNDLVTLSADFKYTKYTAKNLYDPNSPQGNQKYKKDSGNMMGLSQNSVLPVRPVIDYFNNGEIV